MLSAQYLCLVNSALGFAILLTNQFVLWFLSSIGHSMTGLSKIEHFYTCFNTFFACGNLPTHVLSSMQNSGSNMWPDTIL